MEFFDKEGEMRYIKEELKKTDEFYILFKKEFSKMVGNLIAVYFPNERFDAGLDGYIDNYASEILSSTEAVIDKDRNYLDYRLEEELDNVSRLVSRMLDFKRNDEFIEVVHQKVKEQMVRYFDDINELSANGFRLLERNSRMYNLEFAANFQSLVHLQ
ncbi:MAG: hypothetical protein WAO52_16950 [Prolixibacteraceae bacterium]